jgi:putative phage-type endonuclease
MEHLEWLKWRRGGIGSSDAAIIMNASPWRTPRQLWEEKVYGESMQSENSAMTRGKELEPVARSWFEETMNVTVFPKNKVHVSNPWIRASLDGIDLEENIMVEIKCPNKEDHGVAVNGMIPSKYVPQVQHQLLVTGLDGMYYCSFDGSNGAIVEVARDNAYIDAMLEEERKFWDMVLSKTPPDLTDRDFMSMEKNEQWMQTSLLWHETKEMLEIAEAKEKELRNSLIALSENRNAQGCGLRMSKSICLGAIDYKQAIDDYITSMKAHYPEVHFPDVPLEAYRKKSFTKWNFRATT